MQPLLAKNLPNFTKRFGRFIDSEIRHIEIISPTNIKLSIACQDEARGFNWLSINFEFNDIVNASLIDEDKLSFIDMSDGISLSNDGTHFALKVVNSTLYLKSSTLKYEEAAF